MIDPHRQAERRMWQAEVARRNDALRGLLPYRAHRRTCEIDMTEVCTCGMRQAADAARAALTRTEEESR